MRKFPLLWQVTPHFNSLVSSTCQFDASFPHKRPLLFSSPQICHFHTNLSILQKSINSMQICLFQTNPSVPHKSVCSTQRWNDAYQWGICVEVTCGSNRFVCKWRICVQLTDLCRTDGLVLNWRILGAEKESPLCVSDVLNWRVCQWGVLSVSYLNYFFRNWIWRVKLFTIAFMTGSQYQTAWDTL